MSSASPRVVRSWVAVAAACAGTLLAEVAVACPACPVGREARQRVYEQDFARNMLIALLPFALVGIASGCAERIGKSGAKPSVETGADPHA